jgi:hypothetical protein
LNHFSNKRFPLKVCASLVVFLLAPVAAQAHPDNYEDFYNTTQGKGMSSDSGCRIVMCMLNPKGPMADKKCQPDIKTMFYEIAKAPFGHGFIPMCQGFSGVSMEEATNAKGENNGAFYHLENLTVWRSDYEGHWRQIYASTRSPGYMPINGTTNTDYPTVMWNGRDGDGRITDGAASYTSTEVTLGKVNQQSQASEAAFADNLNIDDLNLLHQKKVNVFTDKNTNGLTDSQYDLAVISSMDPKAGTQSQIVETAEPAGAYFKKGDKVVIRRFNPNRGDMAAYKKASSKYGTIIAAPGSNNVAGAVRYTDKNGETKTVALPSAVNTHQAQGTSTYTDPSGNTKTIVPTQFNAQGQATYTDAFGDTHTLTGTSLDNVNVNGKAFYETSGAAPGNANGRSSEYMINVPSVERSDKVNVLDAVLPPE